MWQHAHRHTRTHSHLTRMRGRDPRGFPTSCPRRLPGWPNHSGNSTPEHFPLGTKERGAGKPVLLDKWYLRLETAGRCSTFQNLNKQVRESSYSKVQMCLGHCFKVVKSTESTVHQIFQIIMIQFENYDNYVFCTLGGGRQQWGIFSNVIKAFSWSLPTAIVISKVN